MKNTRKITALIIILVAAACFALTGCAGGNGDSGKPEPAKHVTEEPAEYEKPEESGDTLEDYFNKNKEQLDAVNEQMESNGFTFDVVKNNMIYSFEPGVTEEEWQNVDSGSLFATLGNACTPLAKSIEELTGIKGITITVRIISSDGTVLACETLDEAPEE